MMIKQDLHIHTNLSVCAPNTSTLLSYIEYAKKIGLDSLGVSNHLWCEEQEIPYINSRQGYYVFSESYKKQNFNNLSKLLEDEYYNCDKIKILFGAEAEYNPKLKRPAIDKEKACMLDYLLVSNSHTHLIMDKSMYEPKELHVKFMLDAFENIIESKISEYISAIAHPFAAVNCPYDNRELVKLITDRQFFDCFIEAKKKNIAIEINSKVFEGRDNMESDEMIRMFCIAKSAGCQFTIGSDAHKPETQKDLVKAEKVLKIIDGNDDVLVI